MNDPRVLDDPARLRAVDELRLLGREPEERFDRVTRSVQRQLAVPMAFLNLVGPDALWVTSCVGLDVQQVDRDVAFCSHAIDRTDQLLVPDTTTDPRFADNPLVVDGPRIRAYAGRPVRGPSGHVVGTLCAMDLRPRTWTEQDVQALEDLAAWAEAELARGDVDRRLAAGDELRRQHEQVLVHAGQGILGLDADGVVQVANPAARRLTGWTQESLVGRPLHDTLHPLAIDGSPCLNDDCPVGPAALRGRAMVRGRAVLHRRDGSELPVHVSSAPMRDGERVVGAVLVFDDISEQQAVDRMKDEFVSVVSHELRTPLTALRGSLGLLAAGVLGPLAPEGKQMADVAVASTDRLVRLVDDILDLERLVAGKVVLQRREHDVRELTAQALLSVAPLAEKAGIPLRLQADPVPAWLDGDRITQVLVNLVGNAVKFSQPGSPVDVRVRTDEGVVVLEVEDRGRGIPPEQLERVFDRFAQVDSSDSRDKGGSGLGLAIARNVVEAHDGTITVRSAVGEGTTFTVSLPQRRGTSVPRERGRRRGDQASA